MSQEVEITQCDLLDSIHCFNFVKLVNAYMEDKMGLGKPLESHQEKALIKGLRKHSSSFQLFAMDREKFVGLIVCFINFSTFQTKKIINVHDIIVLKEYRGIGIGKKLMTEVEKIAKVLDCFKVTLEVREDNYTAQGLYKSLGYNECSPNMLFWEKLL